jgi:hypothetical protein
VHNLKAETAFFSTVYTVLLSPKFFDFCEDSRGRLGCYFCECIDVGIAGSQ